MGVLWFLGCWLITFAVIIWVPHHRPPILMSRVGYLSKTLFVKFRYSEKAAKIPNFFDITKRCQLNWDFVFQIILALLLYYSVASNSSGRWTTFVWPSQNIWTLLITINEVNLFFIVLCLLSLSFQWKVIKFRYSEKATKSLPVFQIS